MFTKAFARAIAERAIKTFAQTFGALLIAAGVGIATVGGVSLNLVAGMAWTSGLAAMLSIVTTVGSGALTGGNASLAARSEITTDNGLVIPHYDDRPVE